VRTPSSTPDAPDGTSDPGLAEIVRRWPSLHEAIRTRILALVQEAPEIGLTPQQKQAVAKLYRQQIDATLNIGIELACCDCPDEIRETLADDTRLENTPHDH